MNAWTRLTITAVFWAGAFFAAKEAVRNGPPVTTAFLRFSLAGFLLLGICFLRREILVPWRALPRLLAMAGVGIFLYNLFFFEGLRRTSALNGSLIASANPAITALLSGVFARERTTGAQWAGIFVSFTGVVFVLSGGSLEALLALRFNPGDLLIVGSATCWAVYSILARRVLKEAGSVIITAFACLAGSVLLSPLAFRETGAGWLDSPVFWACILYMAVFPSGIAYVWWNDGVREIGPARASVFINLVPVFVMILSVFSGTLPQTGQVLGGALVLVGVYLTARPAARDLSVKSG